MRITFNYKYQLNLNAILNAQERLQTASNKLEKQTKILTPADDPAGSARVVAIDQQINQLAQYQNNSVLLQNNLDIEEQSLSNIRDSVDQARVLVLKLGNGAYSQTDRAAIAVQLTNIQEHVFDLMNQQDANGNYLFSGYQESQQSYVYDATSGTYKFSGDEGQKFMQVSQSVTIASNDSGKNVFENVNRRFQTTTPTFSGGATAATIETNDQSAFDSFFKANYDPVTTANNNYSLVVDASNNYEIQKNGASLSPAVTGTYTSGQVIGFNGLNLKMTGAGPAQMDFSLQAPEKTNVLNSMNRMIDAVLNQALSGTALSSVIKDTIYELDGAAFYVDEAMSAIGGRQNVIESISGSIDDLQIANKAYRADIYEIDYAEAITELTKQETALQAVQQTFNRVTGTSLFDYIN